MLSISFAVKNGDNLKWGRLWPIHDSVVGVARHRPEAQCTGCKIRQGVAAHGSLGDEEARIVNRLFYSVGGVFAVFRDIRPDVENVGIRKWR